MASDIQQEMWQSIEQILKKFLSSCAQQRRAESLKNCKDEKYFLHKLTQRVKDARQPKFEISDLRSSELKSGLTEYSLNEISQELSKGNQVLVFLNKKGYAPMVFCNKWVGLRNAVIATYQWFITSIPKD